MDKFKKTYFVFIIMLLIFNVIFISLYFNLRIKSENVLVGTFYYVWYDNTRHWNDDPLNIVVDIPYTKYYTGYYSSINETLIFYQLKLIEECGIDFLIISWTSKNSFEDNASKKVFKIIKENNLRLKVALMVEPVCDYDSDLNKFMELKKYIFENYIQPYSDQYFYWNNKPLLGFFVPLNPPDDQLFSIRVIGEQPYAHWPYWSVPPKISKDGVVAILPRYDDSYLSRDNKIVIDKHYTKKLYDNQWDFVLRNKDKINLVLITSWNEYHERTMIEPHIDFTARIENYYPEYIYDKTKSYIQNLKESKISIFGLLPLITIPLLIFAIYKFFEILINKSISIKRHKSILQILILGIFIRLIVIIYAFLSNSVFGLRIPFENERLPDYNVPILNLFARWDAGYYINIAAYGYKELSQWAFRPLFPIILKTFYIIKAILLRKNVLKYVLCSIFIFSSFFIFLIYSFIITNSFLTPIRAELLWCRKGIIDMVRDFGILQWNFNPGVSLIYLIINLPLYLFILITLLYYYINPILSEYYDKNIIKNMFPFLFHTTIYFFILSFEVDYISFARLSLFLFPIFWVIGYFLKNRYVFYFLTIFNSILLVIFLSFHVNWYHVT